MQYAQELLELIELNLIFSENWRYLSTSQIRLTKAALLMSDMLAFALAGVLAAVLAQTWGNVPDTSWLVSQDLQRYLGWLGIVAFGVVIFLIRCRHYSDRKPFWTELGEILQTLLILAVLDLAVIGITRWNSSRLWWGLVWMSAMVLVPLGRSALRYAMKRMLVWQRPTLIVGNGRNAHEAAQALKSESALGFEVVDFLDVNRALQNDAKNLKKWAEVPGVQFVLALEASENHLRESILRKLAHWKVENVSVIPAMRGVPLFGTEISYFFSHEVALLKLRNNLRYWPARLFKRAIDLTLALVLLILLALPLVYIAWLIRRDGGAAIFAHRRVGQSGREFPCFKFRTMSVDSEQQLRTLLASDPAVREEWEREFKLRNDPRVTRVGQYLRRTSLDELPQLLNVIRGEMSLVGPRPVIQAELMRYGDDVDYFLMVRPGMTGLWQVSGRNDLDYETRVYLDTWYVKNWSMWYDIAILFSTIKVVMQGKGSY